MKKKYKLLFIITILTIICVIGMNLYKNYNNTNNQGSSYKIKVGVYEYAPCYYIDEHNNITGYYQDVLNIVDKYDDFDYEYYVYSFEEVVDKLEHGEIDLVVGLNKTEDRMDKFNFSDKSIGVERYGIFSNIKAIKFSDLKSMENCSLGIVKSGYNGNFVNKIFNDNKINLNVMEFKSQSDLINAFKQGIIDLSIQPLSNENYGKIVYEFSSGPVYIAVNKNKMEIINNINDVMDKNIIEITSYLNKSYRKHFNYLDPNSIKSNELIKGILYAFIFLIVILLINSRRGINSTYIQMKIRKRLSKGEYILHYQPIYNPKNEGIVGCEALIRQKTKNGKILSPYEFIQEIEKNNMMGELSIMILKKIISDYKKIHEKYSLKNENYISINLSVNEIMDENFVEQCCNLIKENNIPKSKICVEIIERVKTENVKELNKSILKLKNAGFLIAIDDFGMEYSNLDLLDKIDFDILKLDKYFIYAISKDYVKEEIFKFLSAVSIRSNSAIVIEGVETKEQVELVKKIDNDKIYVQGYYYSKPVSI